MPSTTFYHLPPEKREKLLEAARAEFARVSFPEASINQIIRRAGISRGAFYLYFKDKEELFQYLLEEFLSGITGLFGALLDQHQGDLFAALPALYDGLLRAYHSKPAVYQDIIALMRNNSDMQLKLFPHPPVPDGLLSRIDAGRLNLQGPRDLELIFSTLAELTGHALKDGILSEDPAAARSRYHETLEILKRGMLNTPAAQK